MPASRQILVIDPAVRVAEVDCFNRIALVSPLPCTYHLPGLVGIGYLKQPRATIAGIIVLGSGTSVHESRPWQRPLEDWIRPLLEAGVPTLALCYGHQMVAHLFGGKVEFLHADKHKHVGFREVALEPDRLWGGKATKGKIFVSHREAVTTCPPGMKIVGRSSDVAIDALAHERLPIWTFQPHPEATEEFIRSAGVTGPLDASALAFGHSLVDAFLALAAKQPG